MVSVRWLPDEGRGRVEVAQCTDAHKVWEARGLVLWRPLPPPGWFSLGDWAEEVEGRAGEGDTCPGWLPIVREEAASSQEGAGPFFGAELREVAQREGRSVPEMIETAIAYIEKNGLNAVGLFRIDVTSLVNTLTREIDAGRPIDLDTVANPHAAAGIIKRFLRRLPEPLFPFSAWNSMSEAISTSQTPEESREKIKTAMQQLPEVNLQVMQRVFELLSKVAQHSHTNLMPASNLASMIGPNVLYPHPSQQDPTQPELVLRDVNTANAVVETIITSLDFFFPSKKDGEQQDAKSAGDSDVVDSGLTPTPTTTPTDDQQQQQQQTRDMLATTDENSLERRRSHINVLKQFFEDKAPPRSNTTTTTPTATHLNKPSDERTTRALSIGAGSDEAGQRLGDLLQAASNQGAAVSVASSLLISGSSSTAETKPPSSPGSSIAPPPTDLPLLVAPKCFVKVWDNSGLGSKFAFVALWKAVPPTTQYVALGHVVTTVPDSTPPATNTFRCVHISAAKSVASRKCIWNSSVNSGRQMTLKKYRSSRQTAPCSLWIALPEDGHSGDTALKTGLFYSFPSLDARTEQLFGLRKDCDTISYSKDNLTLPKREFEWEGGEEIPCCHLCGAAFTILRRRHRCRLCGQVFCGTCSVVADMKTVMSRFKLELVCLPCKKQKQAQEKESQESLDLLRKWREEQRLSNSGELRLSLSSLPRQNTDDAPCPSPRADRPYTLAGNTKEKKEAFEGTGSGGWKTALRHRGSRGEAPLLARGLHPTPTTTTAAEQSPT